MSRSGNPRGLSRAFFASGGNEFLEGAHRRLRQLPDDSLPLGSDGRNSLANHGCSESLGSAGIRASGGCLQPAPACRSCNSSQAIPPRTSPAGRALAMARSGGSSRRQSPRLDRAAREAALGSAKSEGNPDRDEASAPSAPAVRFKSGSRNIAAVKRWQSKAAADEFTGARARASKGAAKADNKLEYLAHPSLSKPPVDKERELRKDARRAGSVDLLRAQEQLDRDAKTADNARQESAEAQLQTQASNAQLQNQSNANAAKAPGPAALGQIEAKKMKAPAAPTVPSPQPGVAGG